MFFAIFALAFLSSVATETRKGPIEEDVIFWHYLPGDQDGTQVLLNGTGLSHFTKGVPLILGVHGFSDSHTGQLGSRLRNGFLQREENVNILLINYSKRASSPDYIGAVNNLPEVGEYVAKLINLLVSKEISFLNETYFAGHSLGAHMVNHIAKHLEGGKLRKAFGLDPAGPIFDLMADDLRLDPDDAEFVVVIHTGSLIQGTQFRRGHVDFYPNAGHNQPGCDDVLGACSHARVIALFGESLLSEGSFPSCKCTNWEEFNTGDCSCEEQYVMGWDTPTTIEGAFYLRTNAESPYSQH